MDERDERDAFDRIVEGLDLDLSDLPDLDEAAERHAREREAADHEAEDAVAAGADGPSDLDDLPPELRDDADDDEVPFYRQVPPAHVRPAPGTGLAWAGVLGAPVVVVASFLFGFWVDSWLIALLTVVSIASVAWLFWRLPERGPSHRDWPDDGAEL